MFPEEKKMTANLFIKWDQCRGCGLCEIACSRFHFGKVNPNLSRIRVYNILPGPMSIPMVCSYCSDTPCVNICPTHALQYDEKKGIIIVDEKKCLGFKCGLCAKICKEKRSGVIRFHPSIKYPLICDKCGGDPQCVIACPFKVLDYLPRTIEGYRFADPVEKIADDLSQRYYPADAKKRINPMVKK